jgi:alkylhydroperoxidase family enzyme
VNAAPEPRVPLLGTEEAHAAAASAGVTDAAADLSVFRVWLQHPELAKWLHDLIMGLLWKGSLDARLRELIIMRLGWSTDSVYEWTQHWNIATTWLHVDPDDVLAVRDWQSSDRFGPVERAVLAATDETVTDGAISPSTWAECVRHLGDDPKVLLELPAAIGTWRMVSSMLRSLDVPLEDGVSPWPPDGHHPS